MKKRVSLLVETTLLLLFITHIGLAIHYIVHDKYAYHSPRFDAYLDIQLTLLSILAAVEFIPLAFFYLIARMKYYWGLVALMINLLIIIAFHGCLLILPGEFESIRWFFLLACVTGMTALISLFKERSRFMEE